MSARPESGREFGEGVGLEPNPSVDEFVDGSPSDAPVTARLFGEAAAARSWPNVPRWETHSSRCSRPTASPTIETTERGGPAGLPPRPDQAPSATLERPSSTRPELEQVLPGDA